MLKYILRRLLMIIPVLLGAIIVVFTINYFSTTDPAMVKLGLSASDPVKLEAMRETMGLNRPYIVQLGEYLWNLLHGNLGDSYVYSKTVWELLGNRIPNTLRIGLGAMVISVCVGIPLGLVAALHQNSALDYITTAIAVFMNAMPGFLVAVLLMIVFGLKLQWLPTSGADSAKSFILPIIAAGIGPICQDARMTRSSVLEVIRQDYVRTARAKGIAEGKVITRHVLKNSMVSGVTFLGQTLAELVGAGIVVEQVLGIPGLGRFLVASISHRDYPVVQAIVVILAFWVVLAGTLADLINQAIDPRLRLETGKLGGQA